MNTTIADGAYFSPTHQLASSLSAFYPEIGDQYQSLLAHPQTPPTAAQQQALLTFVSAHGEELFASSSQIESIAALTIPLLSAHPDQIPAFIAALTSTDAFFDVKVNLLFYLYNQINSATSSISYDLITAIATLVLSPASAAAYCAQTNPISPAVIEKLVSDITSTIVLNQALPAGVSLLTAAQLYRSAYDMMVQFSTSFSQRALLSTAFAFLVAHSQVDPAILIKWATDLVSLALSFPSHQISLDRFISYDLLLSNTFIATVFAPQFPAHYELLRLHLDGTLPQVLAYVDAPAFTQVCAELNLDSELTRSNLIALALVPALQAGKGYKLSTLQAILNLSSPDLVEEVLVDATSHGQISTKIDQTTQIVHVSRVIPRVFNPQQTWADIKTKLQAWNKTVQRNQ